jgi:hypothetical protein
VRRRGYHIFLHNQLTDGGEVVSPGPTLPLSKILVLISVRGWANLMPTARLEGLGKLKKQKIQ